MRSGAFLCQRERRSPLAQRHGLTRIQADPCGLGSDRRMVTRTDALTGVPCQMYYGGADVVHEGERMDLLADPPEREEYVDIEASRGPAKGAVSDTALTLTIRDRDGWLSPAAAQWVLAQLTPVMRRTDTDGTVTDTPMSPPTIKLRIQRNVDSGAVLLLPSIDEGISVRAHRDVPARRFYCARLLRIGAVKKGQVIRLREHNGRLLLLGVKAPV